MLRSLRFAMCTFLLGALVAGCAFFCVDAGQASSLSEADQESIVGGLRDVLCVAHVPNECLGDDTLCLQGHEFCQEPGNIGELCADKLSYFNPTRCKPTETTMCCAEKDDGDPDDHSDEIDCYWSEACVCVIDAASANSKLCNPTGDITKTPVKKCKNFSSTSPECH